MKLGLLGGRREGGSTQDLKETLRKQVAESEARMRDLYHALEQEQHAILAAKEELMRLEERVLGKEIQRKEKHHTSLFTRARDGLGFLVDHLDIRKHKRVENKNKRKDAIEGREGEITKLRTEQEGMRRTIKDLENVRVAGRVARGQEAGRLARLEAAVTQLLQQRTA